jgi:Bacterial SH3 domain
MLRKRRAGLGERLAVPLGALQFGASARWPRPTLHPGYVMRLALLLLAVPLGACGPKPPPPPTTPAPAAAAAPTPAPARTAPETVTVRDPDLAREVAQLRMSLLERTAQLADAKQQLDEATTQVVRAMARSRTLATKADAASAMAEAEVTLQQLRGSGGQQPPTEARQAEQALRAASAAFDAENYGGAVYLATQAKRAATAGRGRLAESGATTGAGEVPFAVPVPLTTTARANLRAAPGGGANLVATVPAGTPLTAYAYAQDWIRVTTADGRGAWIYQGLVRGAAPDTP